jgi:hypothetical protein
MSEFFNYREDNLALKQQAEVLGEARHNLLVNEALAGARRARG